MIAAILYTFAALMIFFVLTEIITIKLSIGESYTVELSFIVFAVVFKKSKSYKTVKSKRRNKRSSRRYRFILSLIKHSEVKIKSLRILIPDDSPHKNALRFGIYNGLVYSFLAFLENNSSFFTADNITLSFSEHNNLKKLLEAEFKISLLDVFIASFIFASKSLIRLLYQRVNAQ